MEPNYTSLVEMLTLLTSGAGMVAFGMLVSDFFRNLEFEPWTTLTPSYKTLVMFLVYALVPTIAFVVQTTVSPEVLASIQPYYAHFALLFISGRIVFEAAKKRE